MEKLQDIFRRVLKENHFSQQELADRLDVSQAAVAKYIHGMRPELEVLQKLAMISDVTFPHLQWLRSLDTADEEIQALVEECLAALDDRQKALIRKQLKKRGYGSYTPR